MKLLRRRGLLTVAMAVLAFGVAGVAEPQAKKETPPEADQQALRGYILTRYKIHELGEAISDLADYQDAHPDIAAAMGANGPQGDIRHLAQRIQKYPAAVTLLRKDGFTPREYVVATMTLTQAMSAVTAKLNGAYSDYLPQTVQLIGRTNLTFVERNLDDIVHVIDALSPPPDIPAGGPTGKGNDTN